MFITELVIFCSAVIAITPRAENLADIASTPFVNVANDMPLAVLSISCKPLDAPSKFNPFFSASKDLILV